MTLGILGAGHLASYTVAGLRNKSDDSDILLSPRNQNTARHLADNYSCRIASNNQQVVDQSDVILLSVRPHQLDELLADLVFKADTLIISSVAGTSLNQLKAYPCLSSSVIVRTLLIVSAEVNSGPVPIYPDEPQARQLLSQLGTLIAFDDESMFEVANVHGCMQGWIYFWLDEMVNWTIAQGVDPQQAENMIKQTIQGALNLSDHKHESIKEIGDSIATEGTYTRSGLQKLNNSDAIKAWSKTMQSVLHKLQH